MKTESGPWLLVAPPPVVAAWFGVYCVLYVAGRAMDWIGGDW